MRYEKKEEEKKEEEEEEEKRKREEKQKGDKDTKLAVRECYSGTVLLLYSGTLLFRATPPLLNVVPCT